MSLRVVRLHCVHAVVAKVKQDGSSTGVTVEDWKNKRAYRFELSGPRHPKRGEVVLFSGNAMIEYHRGRPMLAEYYHEPVDGSPREGWAYADVRDAECIVLGPQWTHQCIEMREAIEELLGYPSVGNMKKVATMATAFSNLMNEAHAAATEDSAKMSPTITSADLASP